ncbi:hypothetical protein GBA52_008182 [Prunus armeniaca]|nr:hypothetical protein GBA52_008182 [Prunus armeniaca]
MKHELSLRNASLPSQRLMFAPCEIKFFVFDYLLHAKSLFDSLIGAGTAMSDGELIDYILDGLGHEYKQFVTSLHLRPSLTFDDFFGLLIQEEHLLKRMSSISLYTGTTLTSDCAFNDQQKISHNMRYTPNNNSNQEITTGTPISNVAAFQFVPTPTNLFLTTTVPPLPLQIIVHRFFQFHRISHLSNARKYVSFAIDKAVLLTYAQNMETLFTWPSPTL